MITFGIIDPHPVTQLGLKIELSSNFDRSKIFVSDNLGSFETIKEEVFPDVLILGFQGSLVENLILNADRCTKMFPASLIIVYGDELYMGLINKLFLFGIRGFVSKKDCLSNLFECISSLQQGFCFIGPKCVTKSPKDFSFVKLSKRQAEVASLILKGKRTKEISSELGLNVSTISTVKKIIFSKMNVNNTVELVRLVSASVKTTS